MGAISFFQPFSADWKLGIVRLGARSGRFRVGAQGISLRELVVRAVALVALIANHFAFIDLPSHHAYHTCDRMIGQKNFALPHPPMRHGGFAFYFCSRVMNRHAGAAA
jgi:hypothetical protein